MYRIGNVSADEERTFMIAGEDDQGDQHMVMTTSQERAVAHYRDMAGRLRNVRGNEAFEQHIRPIAAAC